MILTPIYQLTEREWSYIPDYIKHKYPILPNGCAPTCPFRGSQYYIQAIELAINIGEDVSEKALDSLSPNFRHCLMHAALYATIGSKAPVKNYSNSFMKWAFKALTKEQLENALLIEFLRKKEQK